MTSRQRGQAFRYSDFDFGCATAEQESAQNPHLLLEGYLDLHNVDQHVLRGSRFLFLGYKGSGKSAISEHLLLRSQRQANLFVTRVFLGDFPFGEFGQIYQGPTPGPGRYPAIWSWLCLLQLLGSLTKDQGASGRDEPDFTKSVAVLRKLGFLPTPSIKQIVLKSSAKSFKAGLPKMVEAILGDEEKESGNLNFVSVVETLRHVVSNFRTQSQHLLVTDGLDDILLSSDVQFETLAALILEASRLNLDFMQHAANVQILVMCRTDIYERLPGPNKNKIRQDTAIHLDWYHRPNRPDTSNLLALANMKARVADPNLKNLFDEYFPPRVVSSNGKESRETRRYLLDHTRHTPRDFLQLLKHIQQCASTVQRRVSSDQVRSGIRNYSQNYFLPEIKDELVGHLPARSIEDGFAVLGAIARQRFDVRRFTELAESMEVSASVNLEFLKLLFEFGAVGNFSEAAGSDKAHYTYRYRNRHTPFNPKRRFSIHRALLPALNVPHSM